MRTCLIVLSIVAAFPLGGCVFAEMRDELARLNTQVGEVREEIDEHDAAVNHLESLRNLEVLRTVADDEVMERFANLRHLERLGALTESLLAMQRELEGLSGLRDALEATNAALGELRTEIEAMRGDLREPLDAMATLAKDIPMLAPDEDEADD